MLLLWWCHVLTRISKTTCVFLYIYLKSSFSVKRDYKLASCNYLPDWPIVLQRLQYFHNPRKIISHLTPSIESFQQTHFLAMYYSRVFKPRSGPERKCSLPVSVTGYQLLIHYLTGWSRATHSSSLRCCLDRKGLWNYRGWSEASSDLSLCSLNTHLTFFPF